MLQTNKIVNFDGILLPAPGVDLKRWAVVACDQFTGDPDYWQNVEETVCGAPSAYRLTFPEIYLSKDNSARIKNIHAAMDSYLSGGVFKEYKNCAVLTERRTPYHARRLGLVLSIDLEAYSYKKGDKTPIRATEGTIIERIPPRVEIRRGAPLEISHILLLIDDPGRTLIEALYEKHKNDTPAYDTELNQNGGHVTGRLIYDTDDITARLNKLVKDDGFLFAAGDGNHSLATAKAFWDEIKGTLPENERARHPARYALCEAVNIYDPGLAFEPIHRIVYCAQHTIPTTGHQKKYFSILNSQLPPGSDAVETILHAQNYIDEYIKKYGGEVDYIHGAKELHEAAERNAARYPVPIEMPRIEKEDFFRLLDKYGIMPRKSFSLGEGVEKRYYLEARRIK